MILEAIAGIYLNFSNRNYFHRPKPPTVVVRSVKPTPVLIPRLSPTPILTPAPSPTQKPVQEVSPKPVVLSGSITPNPTQVPSDVQGYLMGEINAYRRSQGLSEVRTDDYTCNFASVRASEITSSFSHDGFQNRINSKSLPYPSYHKVTENIAEYSNYKNVVQAWINSPGHAENMRADTPFVCVVQNGNYYAYEGWKP